MVSKEAVGAEKLDSCFKELMFLGGVDGCGVEGGAISEWKDVPMELLLRILSLVDDQTVIRASGVCTGWRDAVCLGLTRICLSWCQNNMNDLVLLFAPKYTNLHTLILRQDKPQLKDHAVETISSCCHELQELDLSKSFKLTDRSLYALAHGCPNLTKININGCSAFSDAALAYLTGFCTKLKSLNLCGCVRAATDRALQAEQLSDERNWRKGLRVRGLMRCSSILKIRKYDFDPYVDDDERTPTNHQEILPQVQRNFLSKQILCSWWVS